MFSEHETQQDVIFVGYVSILFIQIFHSKAENCLQFRKSFTLLFF